MRLSLHGAAWAIGGIGVLYGVIFFGMTAAFWPGHTAGQILLALGMGALFLIVGIGLLVLGSILDHARAVREHVERRP